MGFPRNNRPSLASLLIIAILLGIYVLDANLRAENRFSVQSSARSKFFLPITECAENSKTSLSGFVCNCSNSVISVCPPTPPDREIEKEEVAKDIVGQPWYAEGRVWHYPIKFPRCSMDVCFNYSRCDNMQDDLLVFVYDVPAPPSWYFTLLNTTKWHTTNPEHACMFLVFFNPMKPWPPRPEDLPYWNGGMNHAVVSFADSWSRTHMPEEKIGFASLLITALHQTVYRPGFDISISYPPKHRMTDLQYLKPFERKYFLTFRGRRCLGHKGEGTLRSDDSFREMHNGRDVIVAVSCDLANNYGHVQRDPALGIHCDEDEVIYRNFSYTQLMNSTFGLAPAGRQPNSYRFSEVLSTGGIPVVIADNYVKPFDALIQWHKCILQFPTTEMHRIVPTLRSMNKQEVEKRQEYCLKVYNEYFKDDKALLKATIDSLKARFMGALPNLTPLTRL